MGLAATTEVWRCQMAQSTPLLFLGPIGQKLAVVTSAAEDFALPKLGVRGAVESARCRQI